MDHVCLAFPILAGRTADARSFLRELDGPRKGDFDRSERRIGITKELWYIAALPSGDHLLGYMESADFNHALTSFVQSRDEFDMWFKGRFQEATGVDLNNPPPDFKPPELMSHYDAQQMAGASR